MKYFKAVIEETRRKTVFIEVPDDGNRDLAIKQIDAGIFGGDLPKEENKKLEFSDYDRDLEYDEDRIVSIKEIDMEKEKQCANRYYMFPECVMWDEEQNCITTGWYE